MPIHPGYLSSFPVKPTMNYLQNVGGPDVSNDPLLGYKIREQLWPGEETYFRANPNTTGMAAETGDIILNPYAAQNVNRDAVAKNEALRLYLRERNLVPSFDLTDEQRSAFEGTEYESDHDALKGSIAARIYSGDPSAKATPEQEAWVSQLFRSRPSTSDYLNSRVGW